jgi:amino acid transporter
VASTGESGGTGQMGQPAQAGEPEIQYERLGETKLTFVDVIAQAFGFMGPVFGAILLLVTVVGANNAGKGAGLASPVAIIIAAIGLGALGWIIAQFAKRIHAAGALYDYISAGFGERAGFVFGWVYLGGLIVLAVAIPLLIGGLVQGWLTTPPHNVGVPYWSWDLIYCAILFCVLYFGVKISTRVQLTLVLISATVVTVFMIYVIFKSGSISSKPFNPSEAGGVNNFFYGVLYAILLFVGFESAANLAEETNNPRRNIPRAVLWSVGLVTVYFVLVSFSQAVGFHLDVKAWATSGAPILVLALPKADGGYGTQFLFDLMNVILILDVAAVGIGAATAASRLIFSLARDRRVPGVFAKVSQRYGTPYVSIITLVAIAAAEIIWVRLSHGVLPLNGQPEFFVFFLWMAQYGSLSLAVMYAVVSIAGLVGLWNDTNRVGLVIAFAIALVVTGLAIFSAIYKVPAPFNTAFYWFLGWAVVGVIILIFLVSTGRFRQSAQAAGALERHHEALEQVHPEF